MLAQSDTSYVIVITALLLEFATILAIVKHIEEKLVIEVDELQ